jgi:hypothetical protein
MDDERDVPTQSIHITRATSAPSPRRNQAFLE